MNTNRIGSQAICAAVGAGRQQGLRNRLAGRIGRLSRQAGGLRNISQARYNRLRRAGRGR